MMELLRQYALSLIGGGMVCGVILAMSPKGTVQELLKLLCGIFMTVSVLHPIVDDPWNLIPALDLTNPKEDAREAAAIGELYARNSLAQCIKQQAEEYILDKAAAMDAYVGVEITLTADDIPVPASVTVSGPIYPGTRARLEQIIWEELGISKENQRWIEES